MKYRTLPLFRFMPLKRNGDLKTGGVVNGSKQRLCTDKNDCNSPTPDFYAFKYACGESSKERIDAATVDLPGFFRQTDRDREELIFLKLTGAIALFLAKYDERKWRKYLVK